MSPLNSLSSFETLPTVLVDSIFSFLEKEEAEGTMPLVCSTFYQRLITPLYPEMFVALFEKYGKPLHRLPVLEEKETRCVCKDSRKELPYSLMRLSSKEAYVGVALRIQVQATHLFQEELERLKKRAPYFFKFNIENQILKESNDCEFPQSQGGLIVYCEKNMPTPTWRYVTICPKDNFIIKKLIIREKTKPENQDVGISCPEQLFKSHEKFYSFLEDLLKEDNPDFHLI